VRVDAEVGRGGLRHGNQNDANLERVVGLERGAPARFPLTNSKRRTSASEEERQQKTEEREKRGGRKTGG